MQTDAPETVPLSPLPSPEAVQATAPTVPIHVGDLAAVAPAPPTSGPFPAPPRRFTPMRRGGAPVPILPIAGIALGVLAGLFALGALLALATADRDAAVQARTGDAAARDAPLDRIGILLSSCAGLERAQNLTASGQDAQGRWMVRDGLGTDVLVDLDAGTVAVVAVTHVTVKPASFVPSKGDDDEDERGGRGRGRGDRQRDVAPTTVAPAPAPAATTPPPPPPYAACAA